jgi:hypothetical protein
MNLLLRYSLGFDLWLLVILLSFATIVSSENHFFDYSVRYSSVPMPVITRSKARLLTGLSKELSEAISSTSSKEFLESSSHPSTISSVTNILQHTTQLQLTTTNISSLPLLRSSLSSSPLLDHCASIEDKLFQTSNLEFQNLEFSNAASTPISSLVPVTSSLFSNMEANCKGDLSDLKMSPDMINIAQMIANLSLLMTNQTQSLEDKLSRDFNTVIRDNKTFKNNLRAELDGIRQLLDRYKISSDPNTMPSSPSSHSPAPTLSSLPQPQVHTQGNVSPTPVAPSHSLLSVPDPQTNLMIMLTETFSKLNTTLSEKKEDIKYDWPKFSVDQRKFHAWYMAIVTQISLPPWQDLYDATMNDVRLITTNLSINAKLYAKLLICLERSAFQNIVSREHLRANGLLLLQDLVQTYKLKHVPEVIAAKTSNFWGSTKRQLHETIDDYYNRFRELLYEISCGPDQISMQSAMQHFLFTLGSEFETIQNNYRLDNLPPKWKTTDWPTLFFLCQDYLNSVKPQGVTTSSTNSDGFVDHTAHQKKVKNWFMNPSKFCKDIEAEQCKHPNKCIYHLSKTHPTEDCSVKKECVKLLSAQKSSSHSTSSSVQSGTVGQLCHITEELSQDEEPIYKELDVSNENTIHNDTNDEVLSYFSHITRHYLHLVKTKPELITRHDMVYPIIADSGANFHMFKDRVFFAYLSCYWSSHPR